MTYEIKTFNDFKARIFYDLSLGGMILFRAKKSGFDGNNISVSVIEKVRTTVIPPPTPENPEDPPSEPTTEVTIEEYTITASQRSVVDFTFSRNVDIVFNPVLLNKDYELEATCTYNSGVFSISPLNIELAPGKLFKSENIIFSIPIADYQDGDVFKFSIKKIEETFTAQGLTSIITLVNNDSKLINVFDAIQETDSTVFTITQQEKSSPSTISTIDGDIEIKTYSHMFLKNGVGLPTNYDFVNTGPTPMIHINYSETNSDFVNVVNKIFRLSGKEFVPN